LGRSRGISVMLAISAGHHGWFGQIGAIKIKSMMDSIIIFCRTRKIRTGGGYAYTVPDIVHG